MAGSDNEFDKWVGPSGNKAIADPRERMLDKLRKILEVQNRAATEAEAMQAASLLQRFLTEHNLSVADLEKKGQTAPKMAEGQHDLGKAAWKWKLDLAEGIAEFYYCAPLVDRYSKKVAFAGRPDNVEALTMLYAWVVEQIKQIATVERRAHYDTTGEHIDPLRWQIDFGVGATERVIDRLRELKARQQEDQARNADGDVVALTLHHEREVSDYLEQTRGYRLDGRKTKIQLEREAAWKAEAERKDELRIRCTEAGDMEPFYDQYPWERPETPEQIAKREKADAAYWKKEERNARRRTGPAYRERKAEDPHKAGQRSRARNSGRAAADKVNLQPFITGHVDNKKKVG